MELFDIHFVQFGQVLAVSGQKMLAISITDTFLLWSEYPEKMFRYTGKKTGG